MTMTKEEEFMIEIITKYVVPIMFSIIVLTGSIGNFLVIYVVSFIILVVSFIILVVSFFSSEYSGKRDNTEMQNFQNGRL